MAGNMQPMGGPGGPGGQGAMMPQQQSQQFANSANGTALKGQMQNYLLHAIKNCPPPPGGPTWHSALSLQERLGKAMHLATNVHLAQQGSNHNIDIARIAEYAATFERDSYNKAPSKEAWSAAVDAEITKYFHKRAQNIQALQTELNQNHMQQAQAQQHQQNMMGMQGMQFAQQMGRGMPPNFQQQMQRSMQMPNMQAQQQQRQQQQAQQQFRPQQQQQQQPQAFQQQQFAQQQFQQQQPQQQQQQQLPMGMANNMNNQGGANMGQNPQMMAMQQNRPPMMQELMKLAPGDKKKVSDLATKMLAEASPDKRQLAQQVISQRIPSDQLQRMVNQGQNPLHLYFQQQAYSVLRANAQSVQARPQGQGQPGQQQAAQQNLNAGQAPMMQQQASRQGFQQRQNMANPQAANDFNQQFANNQQLDSIMDQQLKGFIAQESGQPVVPASNSNSRPPSSQPMAASMSNQNQNQVQNQTPRPPQQQPTQQQTQQQQQQLAMQMRMNQQNQPNQAQLHPQAQMQQQGLGPSQSPGMGTLNTPVGRPANGMDQSNGQGMQNFAGQPFKQAMGANPNLMNAFMTSLTPDQRSQVYAMSQEQLQNAVGRWQSSRRGAQMQQQQQQQRPPSQMNQTGNMNRQPVQGMPPQMGQPNGFNQRVQPPTTPTSQAQTMMDSMDLPPNIHQQEPFMNMPQEVRKWKDLRAWLGQNPNGIPPNVRANLGTLQHRQFQTIMQKRMAEKMGQNPNMGQNVMQGQPQQQPQQPQQPQQAQQMAQQQNMQKMQQPVPNGFPAHLQHVSPNEIASVRQNNNIPPNTSDEQVKRYVQGMRVQRWKQMSEAQRAQMQAQFQGQGQQMGGPDGQAQQPTPTQTLTTPQQAPAPTPNMAQNSQPKPAAAPTKTQAATANKNKKATPSQASKNLKRTNADISTEGNNAQQQQRKGSQQQSAKNNNAAATNGEDANVAQAKKLSQPGSDGSDNLSRLRTIGQEEQKKFSQEPMPDIQMSPDEYSVTVEKLRRIVVDMGKIGRGLSKWYGISRDDDRARAFFRMRLRIIKQFHDGELMKQPKPTFSINAVEIDTSRSMLEGMARDIATHFTKPKQAAQGQGAQSVAQNLAQASNAQEFANPQQRLLAQKHQQQLMQQQQQQQQLQAQQAQKAQQSRTEQDQSAPAPLNAANLEKNTQALKNQKASKGSKAPSAPTTTQPPVSFPIGNSPHGNPNYGSAGKKDFTLAMPPNKKRKQAGQNSATATPSPQVATKTPPVPQTQPQKPQEQPKPAVLCKDPECQESMEGYPNAEALERHVQEEHVKPKQDPVKFLAENLALALGLESDGSAKKGQKQAPPSMSRRASKQGVSALGTPKSEPGSMNRSASLQSKADPKAKSAPASPKTPFNAQAVFAKLGFPNGISAIAWDPSVLRNLTPKETPESAKDSGTSEPNTELFDMSLPDFTVNWDWKTSNEDILLGPPIPWKPEYVPQPGDDDLIRDGNYKETDWSDNLWNVPFTNQMDTTGWNMDVS